MSCAGNYQLCRGGKRSMNLLHSVQFRYNNIGRVFVACYLAIILIGNRD